MIRIGIDVGGANTDAVVLDGAKVLAGVKAATTGDVMSGVVAALAAVLEAAKLPASAIDVVMIGATHFTNAVVQRRDLAQTAAVRLGLPATASLPPMVDWPDDLKAAIGGHYYLAHGGHEFDGREISALDEEAIVPDLIMNLHLDTGEPITTETLRYGQSLATIGLPAHELMTTPRALEVVGPKAFGYPDIPFVPLARKTPSQERPS